MKRLEWQPMPEEQPKEDGFYFVAYDKEPEESSLDVLQIFGGRFYSIDTAICSLTWTDICADYCLIAGPIQTPRMPPK